MAKRRPFSPVSEGGEPLPSLDSSKKAKPAPFIPPLRLPSVRDEQDESNGYTTAGTEMAADAGRLNGPSQTAMQQGNSGLQVAYEAFWIDVMSVDENCYPPRHQYSDSAIMEIADSILANGQRDAIHVIPHPTRPGRFIVGDGWTRVQAIRAKNIQGLKVKAIVHHHMNEEEAAWLGYAENEERQAHTDFDRAMFFKTFREKGWTWERISDATHVPVGTLYPYGNYDSLDVDLLDYAKRFSGKVTVNAVALLKRLTDLRGPEYALNICKSFVEEDQTFRWLKEKIQAAADSASHRSGRKKSQVNFQRRYASGSFRLRIDGQVEISGTIPPEKLEEFNAHMDKFLAPYFGSHTSESGDQTEDSPTAPGGAA
jgi:ParB family chromosome partitioning protein